MKGVSSFGGAMFIGGAPVQSTTAGHYPVTIANLTVTLTDCQLRDNVANGTAKGNWARGACQCYFHFNLSTASASG
jgi:hypothetical protein